MRLEDWPPVDSVERAENFLNQKFVLMQNDLFSTVVGTNLSPCSPGLLTWKPVSAFTLIMKLPGSSACYSSTSRRFAALMFIIIDPRKEKTPSSQTHTRSWKKMRESCEILCFPLRRGGSFPENMVAQLGNCCTTKCPAQPNTCVWGRVGDDQFVCIEGFCLCVWQPLFICVSMWQPLE